MKRRIRENMTTALTVVSGAVCWVSFCAGWDVAMCLSGLTALGLIVIPDWRKAGRQKKQANP